MGPDSKINLALNPLAGDAHDPGIAATTTSVFFRRVPLADLVNNCMVSVLQQGALFSLPILIMCFLFKVLCHTVGEGFEESGMTFIPRQIIHISSGCLGVVILHHLFQDHTLVILSLGAMGYFMLLMSRKLGDWKMAGAFAILVCFITEYICESSMIPEAWHRIRGPVIILSMKIISIGFDLDADLLLIVPGIFEYFGYIFNIGTVVFGPWVSFLDYMTVLQIKERQMNFSWICAAFRAYMLSLLCLLYSTCLSNWLIMDGSYKWYIAFRDAQSFRFSHYFTCFVAEATALASGVGALRISAAVLHSSHHHHHQDGSGGSSKDYHHHHRDFGEQPTRWDLKVTRPLGVEFPRSLAEVVTHWHIPMHRWLKQYVFRAVRGYGAIPAVLATYAASSLLHGLNFQLSAVLLSLGFYTAVEYLLRRRLADIFSCCIEARRCRPNCGHRNSRPWAVTATNLGFGLLAMYHLAYLGLMFDASQHQEKGSAMSYTLLKWAQLDFASHIVALVMLLFYLLIR